MYNNLLEIKLKIIKFIIVVIANITVGNIYSCVNSTLNRFLNVKQHAVNIITSVGNNIPLKALNGIDIFISSKNPVNTVKITHIVEYISGGKLYTLFATNTTIIFVITVIAVGIDLLITFPINLPFTLALFGSNANINDGIPIHTKEIKLNCIGAKG